MEFKLDSLLKVTKENYKRLLVGYEKQVENNFGLSAEKKDDIDKLFSRTGENILSECLERYSINVTRNLGKKTNYSVEIPAIAKKDLSGSEKQYLLFLYLNKMEEYCFEEVGFQDASIIKKYCSTSKLDQDLIIGKNSDVFYSKECYFLHLSFSPRRNYSKRIIKNKG